MSEGLFQWRLGRGAGVLLHPSALPGAYGIGAFGNECRTFLKFLASSGMKFWQLCPLGPTGYGDSPYQCFSAFALNPYFLDFQKLLSLGLIGDTDLALLRCLPNDHVDYGTLYVRFWPAVHKLYCNSLSDQHVRISEVYGSLDHFIETQAYWLKPYALFMALKRHYEGKPWIQWPEVHRNYTPDLWDSVSKNIQAYAQENIFIQYILNAQWAQIKDEAIRLGIRIVGDIPIFVGIDSADVWSHRHLFQLDKQGQPRYVAGVPPDYFAPKGQLWGNPLFDWSALKKDDYAWWMLRVQRNCELFDVVRLDHFRGFCDYWSIPAGAQDATVGTWEEGPGWAFFKILKNVHPNVSIIAEDLGYLSEAAVQLRRDVACPGMAILQFAFDGNHDNPYLPHNLHHNTVIYTGTHDNDTSLGWYRNVDEIMRDYFRRYLRIHGDNCPWDMLRVAYESTCALAVVPLQDLMSLGSEARFNTPGKAEGNWQWRYTHDALSHLQRASSAYLKTLAHLYGRD